MIGASKLQPAHRMRQLLGVQVVGTGGYVPDHVVSNTDLGRLGFDPDWIMQRTGIRERRHAASSQATSDLALEAGRRCIERAGVSAEDVDLLIVGTFTPDVLCPSTACHVQHGLGVHAPAMDLHAACAGFVYSLITAMQYVATGCSELALVIGADCNSRILNPKDERTYPLFGDGAGAVLIAPGGKDQGLLSYTLGADGSGARLLTRPLGGSRMPLNGVAVDHDLYYMQMEGRAVFKWAVRLVEDTTREVLHAADMAIDDVDLFIVHQANVRIIDAAVNALGVDRDKVVLNLDRFGNTSAGSIPLALDEAMRAGRIRRGSTILTSGFGAGLAWGTALWRW